MVTMEHKQSKPTVYQGSPNYFESGGHGLKTFGVSFGDNNTRQTSYFMFVWKNLQ
jgi:hypothetical protein